MTDIGPKEKKLLTPAEAPEKAAVPVLRTPPLVDDPHIPEVFASFCAGAGFEGPVVRIVFASNRPDHSAINATARNVANLRLVMAIPAAQQMCEFLTNFLQNAGLNTVPTPSRDQMQ